MQNDTISYDTLNNRPLPKWLIDQKAGLTAIQPQKIVMREDNSLNISIAITGIFILLVIAVLTIYIQKKYKNKSV
jgi:heme/copper-type cytochrome/quinol oxidase subunit 2